MTETLEQDQSTTLESSDEQCLKDFVDILTTRVSISTGFIPDEKTGVLTHQVLQVTCGDFSVVSNPEPLVIPFIPAPADLLGVTIN